MRLSLPGAAGAVASLAVAVTAGSAFGQAAQQVQLQLRFVPQTGGFGAANPLTLTPPVNGPVSLGTTPATRTLRFRLDYRVLDLNLMDTIHPSGLAATSFLSITGAPSGNTSDTSIARGILSNREATSGAAPPPGAANAGITGNTDPDNSVANANGRTGLANPFRGGMSDQNNNNSQPNGVVSGLSINNILPIALSQTNQGLAGFDDGSGNPAFPLSGNEWYPLFVFTITAGNASAGSVTFTTSIQPDPQSGNTFLFFQNGLSTPQSVSNPNAGSASITVNIPAVPAPGATGALAVGALVLARRRRN